MSTVSLPPVPTTPAAPAAATTRSGSASPRTSSPIPSSSNSAHSTHSQIPSSDASGSENEAIQFLVHSQQSVGSGEQPRLSHGKHDKKARKRTSPQDQAILEAAYKQNPKPDKVARLDIVKMVQLNEKEVQIWFQNRRQTTRRKSRPLLPHEIEAFGLGGMAALLATSSSTPQQPPPPPPSDTPTTVTSPATAAEAIISTSPAPATTSTPTISTTPPAPHPSSANPAHPQSPHADTSPLVTSSNPADVTLPPMETPSKLPALRADNAAQLPATVETPQADRRVEASKPTPTFSSQTSQTSQTSQPALNDSTPFSFSQETSPPLGYLSNRRHAPSGSFSSHASPRLPSIKSLTETPDRAGLADDKLGSEQSTPSSHVRLSLSLDGRAELVSGIPSPPRPASANSKIPRRHNRLQRSQSAIPISLASAAISINSNGSNGSYKPPNMPLGRSRDARTWELCCDSSARDELMTQAENESSGSAVAAISLLRSTSATALKSNSNKRNASMSLKRSSDAKQVGKKPRLSRASSSLARLQSNYDPSSIHHVSPAKPHLAPPSSFPLARSPSGDSDKENWEPAGIRVGPTGNANARRHPLPSIPRRKLPPPQLGSSGIANARRVLGDNNAIPTLAGDLGMKSPTSRTGSGAGGVRKNNLPPAPAIFDDAEGQKRAARAAGTTDPEVERFMRGEISPSKKGDLDCIQGLLSLSQGNWR